MSSEILYKERRIHFGDENTFVKSDKGRSIVKGNPVHKEEQKFLSIQRLLFFIRSVFLPEGFPDSVHPDYISYQIWDTVQAFASTILGTLTTHSILTGVGVGEATATPLAATISWILKDGAGMIGRILFAWWNGSQLDAQCKKWRIFADVLNDLAMGIELLLPYFASNCITLILCVTTTMKSIVGVAGGATRAALTQHQALHNNLADVSAKDGSQETFVNLVASFVGIFLLSSLHQSASGGLALYFILVIVHIYANYSAVRALRLSSLNEDRLAILMENYLTSDRIVNVEECNRTESLLLFQKATKKVCGFDIALGTSLSTILQQEATNLDYILRLRKHFQKRKFIIVPDVKNRRIHVGLDEKVEQIDILQSYFTSCLYGRIISSKLRANDDIDQTMVEIIVGQDLRISRDFERWFDLLKESDWDHEVNLLPIDEWRGQWDL